MTKSPGKSPTLHSAAAYAKEGIGCGPKKLHTKEEYAAEGIGSEVGKSK